jgi:hypothetical protein
MSEIAKEIVEHGVDFSRGTAKAAPYIRQPLGTANAAPYVRQM